MSFLHCPIVLAYLFAGSILWWFVKGRKTRPVGQTVGASASAGSKVVAVEREVPDVYCKVFISQPFASWVCTNTSRVNRALSGVLHRRDGKPPLHA